MTAKDKKINNVKKKGAKVRVYTKKNKRSNPESVLIKQLQEKYEEIDSSKIKLFSDFPLSSKTLKGLKNAGYIKPTEIQRETIGLALQAKDILGAAQTGSGKTLAFLVPMLEVLYCKQWTKLDGLGALVITPTRELAYQIFETLRKIGLYHDFSAGLIIGGKDLKFETKRMDQCNIIIGTPGRLLQHMDENPLFDCVNMQVLVLDEADRCLDMGFQQTMNAIIANLPLKRQTLLFSATQTKSVKDLARLSLKDPCYVSVHENLEHSTPSKLVQSYVICKLEDKISILWSFIKNHLKKKCIIFLASCKQVKYVYEMFCRLRPGTSLLALYGTLHQLRRMEIYESFCRKTSAVLFATDLAARGLDFPEVHWVVQADCPEDSATYIHRVGRTARYHRGGESLLLLLPSEIAMVDALKERKIPIEKIEINTNKLRNPVQKMQAILTGDTALKETAQRAFVAYAKSVFLMKNKQIFDVNSLDTDSFSKSLGLITVPRIRFLQRMNTTKSKNTTQVIEAVKSKNIPQTMESSKVFNNLNVNDSEDNFFSESNTAEPTLVEVNPKDDKKKILTKVARAKFIMKNSGENLNKKITFDEEGVPIVQAAKEKGSEIGMKYDNENAGIDLEEVAKVLREEDKLDKRLFQERIKAQHKNEKRKLKEKNRKQQEEIDDFGSDEDEQPDLSWLPDPDKIYGKADDVKDASDNHIEFKDKDDDSSVEYNIQGSTNTHESMIPLKTKKRKKKMKKFEDGLGITKKPKVENLSVNESEELAMLLLRHK